MSNTNNYNDIKLDNLSVNGGQNNRLVQKKYLIQNATSINTTADYIYTKTTNNQTNKITTGNYYLTLDTGNVELTSLSDSSNAILLYTPNGGILLKSSNGSLNVGSDLTEITGEEINIGNSNTGNINLTSIDNITINTDAITQIATDDIIIKSTDGQVILDTSPTTGNNALTIENDGDIIINGNESLYGYQLEVVVEKASTGATEKNGIAIINNGNTIVSPEYRTVYNTSGGNRTINSMGIYSPGDSNAKYREYTGYQYGNQIISIQGEDFNNNDIGRTIYFQSDNRNTEIINLGTIILPADNTYASSGNELTVGGIYTNETSKTYIVKVDSNSSNEETFRWSSDGGQTWINNYIPIDFAYQKRYPLNNGVYIEFNSNTGFNVDEYWTIQAKRTAIVNSNIIINGSTTNDGSTGNVVTTVVNNVPTVISSILGSPVFSNITGNIALSRLQTFTTSTNGLTGYLGTETNNDLVLQTAGEPRFTITADGSLGIGQDTIDGRIQAASKFNKSFLVNGNILNSNVIADNGSTLIGNNSNLASNILQYQQNPTSTELNTGGYVVVYESQELNGKFNIYGDYFTANGDKVGSAFQINKSDTDYNQSHPHVTKSGTSTSDNYLCVWSSNITGSGYGIRAQLVANNNETQSINDIIIAASGYTPRATGLKNGNYVVTYGYYNSTSTKYEVKYNIFNSDLTSEIKAATTIASSGTKNYLYPYVIGLSSKDANRPSGFVIAYLKQTYSDNRYQVVAKLFDANGSNESSEIAITTTTISGPGEVGANSDLSLSDGLVCMETLPDVIASNENGGFLIAYKTNYTSAVDYSDVVSAGARNVYSIRGNGSGTLSTGGTSIDPITGIQTLSLTNVNGSFLVDDQIYLVGENGNLLEKIASVTQNTIARTANLILSREPKNISVARFDSTGTLVWRNKTVATTPLTLDNELNSLTSNLPEDYLRSDNNHYAYRSMPVIKSNDSNEILVSWNNGSIPSIYYQHIILSSGEKSGGEYILGAEIIGLRQVNPVISRLLTRQGYILGYNVAYNTGSMDLSKTAIYQEIIGSYSYIAHFRNEQIEYVIDNEGQMGLGTKNPEATLHIKSLEREKTVTSGDICSTIMENSTSGIINNNDSHRMSFKDGDGNELARMSVKYTNNYQDFINNNLVSYFKFDETSGTVVAKNYGVFNIQSGSNIAVVNNLIQDGQLINFNVNKCWVNGKINNGLDFNGTSSYVKIPNDGETDLNLKTLDNITVNDFTISFWFKIDGEYVFTDSRMDIFSIGSDIVGSSTGGGYFQLYLRDVNSIGSLFPCFTYANELDDTNTEVTTSTKVNDNNWHNLVVVHTRGTTNSVVKIYLDNTEISDDTLSGKIHNTNTSLIGADVYLGSNPGGTNNFFRGIIDEFRVYNTAFTTAERNKVWKYGNETRGQFIIQTAGDNSTFNNLGPGFTLDDTGKILGTRMKNQIYYTLTGTILAQASNTTIIGTNTNFLSEVKAGDVLYIDNATEVAADENELNAKLYTVISVISNTELTINRYITDVISNTIFSGVTVRPSILSLFDINDNIKGFVNYNGDFVIGEEGKSNIEYSKLEIRGGDTASSKNGLLISSITTANLNTDGGRTNRIITQSKDTTGTISVLQSMITSSHYGTGSDNKSKIQFWLNDGTANTDITELVNVFSLYENSVVIGTESSSNILGDFQIISQNGSEGKFVMFSEEDATGVFTERSSLIFYGTSSYNHDEEDSALARIQISNDNPYPPDEQLVNGRIDLQVNNQNGSRITGLKTKLAINSEGKVGIHNINPENIFTLTPEFLDNDDIYTASITGYTQSSNIITFSTDLFNGSYNPSLLRAGILVVNDGSNLNSYMLDNNTTRTLNPTQTQLRLKSGYSLTDNTSTLVGKSFNIYYPGIFVNKYGLVGIGDANFNDTEISNHLTISGNTVIKGDLHFSSNIDSTISNVFIRASNDGSKLQIKDNTTDGYINLMVGPKASAILETGTNRTLDWASESTIIVNAEAIITLPTPSSKYEGYIFTVKNISSSNVTIYSSVNIDNSSSNIILSSTNDVRQFQTDGVEWYILNSSTADAATSNSLSDATIVSITAPTVDIDASTEVNISNNLKIGGTIYLGSSQTELVIGELGTTDNMKFETTSNNKNIIFTSNINGTSNTEIIQIGSISGNPGILVSGTNSLNFNDSSSNISSSSTGNLSINTSSNINLSSTNTNINSEVNITGNIQISGSNNLNFNNTSANISSSSSGVLDIKATNVNVSGTTTINNKVTLSKKIVVGVDTITTSTTNVSARIELITSSLDASSKSIILPDNIDNGQIVYYNCNLGSETGELLNIFYYNANASGSANIDFGASNIYGGSGAGRYLVFNGNGQSSQLMYIHHSSPTISGWRIINSGADFY